MSTRIRPSTGQALAGMIAGHRMAGMEPSSHDIDMARRVYEGELTADEAVRQGLADILATND